MTWRGHCRIDPARTGLISAPIGPTYLSKIARVARYGGRVAQEGGDRLVGAVVLVVQPPRQAEEVGGIVGKVGAARLWIRRRRPSTVRRKS